MKAMFSGCTSLTKIVGLENFDMKNVKDISQMFMDCRNLTDAAVEALDLEVIETDEDAFLNCPINSK